MIRIRVDDADCPHERVVKYLRKILDRLIYTQNWNDVIWDGDTPVAEYSFP